MDYPNTGVSQPNMQTPGKEGDFVFEISELESKLTQSNTPVGLKEDAMRNITRLKRMAKWGNYSSEFETVDKYIDWITRIPWGIATNDNLDIQNAKKLMDDTHYGMDTVKNMILDYLATMQLQSMRRVVNTPMPTQVPIGNPSPMGAMEPQAVSSSMVTLKGSSANAPVLLFVGLQGVGKTSIAKSIAKSMDREFARISLGAIGDVRTLRGTPKQALDAEPGSIVKALIRCKTMNPVILLDEIEKSSGNAGLLNDVMAALLEILDPEQNSSFVDHYIDYPVDLSKVFFICTANNLGGLSAALLDRVEVIRFTSYSDSEKEVIAKQYILPKVLKNLNLTIDDIQITDEVWPLIIRPVGFDAGIRQLERNITTLVRSAARMIVEGRQLPIIVNNENLNQFVLPDQGPLS